MSGKVGDATKALTTKTEVGQSVHKRIMELKETIQISYLEIVELLIAVKEKSLFHALGFGSFEEYLERVAGFKKSTFYHLKLIRDVFVVKLGLKNKDVDLEWSKGKELARLPGLTKDNAREWIKKAKAMTREEIIDLLRTSGHENYKSDGKETEQALCGLSNPRVIETEDGPEKWLTFRAPVSQDMADALVIALKAAGQMSHSQKLPQLLNVIITVFLANRLDDLDQSLQWHLKLVEDAFKVKLLAFKNDEVMWGEDAYKKIMAPEPAQERKEA